MRGWITSVGRRSGRAAAAATMALLVVSSPVWAQSSQNLKIGFVNYARLIQESPQAKAVQDQLRSEFATKQRDLSTEQQDLKTKQAALDRDGATMSADQRTAAEQSLRDGQRDLQNKASEYQDDFNARQNQEMSKLSKALVEQVQAYAQAQGFDLVLADGVIFANPKIDITAPVLAQLQASRGTASPAPRASRSSGH